ncbi:MAG: flagellar basal body-associated FliL family protein [Pseudomonadota bacterium]
MSKLAWALAAAAPIAAASLGFGVGEIQKSPGGFELPVADDAAEQGGIVALGQFVAPLMEEGRARGHVLAQIRLEAMDYEALRQITRETPRVRHVVLGKFYSLAKLGVFEESQADVADLAAALKSEINAELAGDPVKSVFFDRLLVQGATGGAL